MSVEIAPGHGRPGIQKARMELAEKLLRATREQLGPSKPWTAHIKSDTQGYPFYQLALDTRYGLPFLDVRFLDHVRVWLHPWPSGPGFFGPQWCYDASRVGYFSPEPKTWRWESSLVEPPESIRALVSTSAQVLATVDIVEDA